MLILSVPRYPVIDFGIELHGNYPVYRWFPEMMVNATHSAENLAHQLHDYQLGHPNSTTVELAIFIRTTLLQKGLGVYDATEEEVNRLINDSDPWPASYLFADLISRRAQVGWSTHGHSGSFTTS